MKRIRIAQIGVTHEHAPAVINSLKLRSDLFEIAGVVDDTELCKDSPHMGGSIQDEYYSGLPIKTMEEVLNDPTIEAVTVETANLMLTPVALQFMEKGIPIYMDKPGSPDLQLYKKLLAGCKAKSLPFQIGYMFRVNPAFEFARKTIQKKLIGDLTFMELDMNHCYGGEPYQEYMRRLPGGIMYNLGCHLIDFTVRTLGAPQKVTPYLRSVKGDAPDTQNLCMAVLEYENALVNIRACSKAPISDYANGRTMTIEGTNGSIFCKPLEIIGGPREQELELYIHKDCGDFPAGRHFMRFAPPRDRHEKQLEEFAATIRGEAKESLTREHDLLTHEVILAASGFENIVIGKEKL